MMLGKRYWSQEREREEAVEMTQVMGENERGGKGGGQGGRGV